MRNFRKLSIWSLSHSFVLKIYSVTKLYPKDETFGLTSQMRRSASSVPTNIAEGAGRTSNPDFRRFLTMGFRSSSELEYQLIFSRDLKYLSEEVFKELEKDIIRIRKMIHSFIKNIPSG